MSATVELVLAVEVTAASAWIAGPAAPPSHEVAARSAKARNGAKGGTKSQRTLRASSLRVEPQADMGAIIADAVSRMPAVTEVSGMAPSTIRAFVDGKGATRVLLAVDASGVERIIGLHTRELAPGVRCCEVACNATLDRSTPLELDDGLRTDLRHALGKLDDFARSPALAACSTAWQWKEPDGAVVDIELRDVRNALCDETADGAAKPAIAGKSKASPAAGFMPDRKQMPVAFCELRLSVQVMDGRTAAAGATAMDGGGATTPTGEQHAEFKHSTSAAAKPGESVDSTLAALQALFVAAGALAATLPVFPILTDGYARACAAAAPPTSSDASAGAAAAPSPADAPVRAMPVELSRACSTNDAFVRISANIVRQWFANEAGARDGVDPEFVHQMRVALRRLKTLMKVFPRWRDEAWERSIAPEIGWLGTLLGQTRDLDVFVDATLPALVAADLDAAAWASLLARAEAWRTEAREQVRQALRTHRYAMLSLSWLKWLVLQRFSAGPLAKADKTLAGYAAKRVRKHYKRLCAKPDLTALNAAERHHRRIAAKHLRYTLEFFESLTSRKTRRKVSKQLGRIQSVLGDGSDASAALRFLETLAAAPYQHGLARGWCEAVNRWSAREGERLVSDLRKPKIVRGR